MEEEAVRVEVIRHVMRLIDFGKGAAVPEFEDLTLGQIADKIIACVRASEGATPDA